MKNFEYPEILNPMPLKHSGFGIASFIISLALGLLTFITVVIAGILESTTPGGLTPESPASILVGLGIILEVFICAIGLVLGIVGIFQKNKKKIFSILGIVFNSFIVLGVVGLILIGTVIS